MRPTCQPPSSNPATDQIHVCRRRMVVVHATTPSLQFRCGSCPATSRSPGKVHSNRISAPALCVCRHQFADAILACKARRAEERHRCYNLPAAGRLSTWPEGSSGGFSTWLEGSLSRRLVLTLCASLEQVSDASVQAACMLILKTTRLRLVRFIDSIRCFDSLLRFMDSIHGFDSLIRFVDSIT